MGNIAPFVVMVAINIVIFTGMGGLTGDTDIGFLSLGLRNTIDITPEGENSTVAINNTGADFSELQGTSGVSLGQIFNTVFLVLGILVNLVIAMIGAPILILFGTGIPVLISIPLAVTMTILNILAIFGLVSGRD